MEAADSKNVHCAGAHEWLRNFASQGRLPAERHGPEQPHRLIDFRETQSEGPLSPINEAIGERGGQLGADDAPVVG